MVSSAKEKVHAPVAPGDLVAGRYRVVRVLASGGMGIVVEAMNENLKAKVALKFLHPHVLEGKHGSDRFLREARLAAMLQTEHVVRLYDVGTLESGAPYAVMELLEGADAASYAKSRGPLAIADAVEIVVQACDAMVQAHRLNVIHRDLKPHNLFVTQRANGTMLVKVLDFGVSKALNERVAEETQDLSLTDSSVTVGSPLYMAPEQMRASKDANKSSDIWSLGIILYELLSGRVPFDGNTVTELCLKVVNDPAPPLREFRAEIPDELARIVSRCLEKDPAKRFENVALLAQALEPFASGAGATRGWQSQVATGDSLDLPDLPSEVATDSSREKLLESGARPTSDHAPPSSRGPQRRIFAQGLASGATLTAIGALIAIALWLGLRSPAAATNVVSSPSISPSAPPPTASALSPSSPSSASAPASAASALPTSPPPATAIAHHSSSAAPSASASASASSRPFTPPNGAPILH